MIYRLTPYLPKNIFSIIAVITFIIVTTVIILQKSYRFWQPKGGSLLLANSPWFAISLTPFPKKVLYFFICAVFSS